MEMTTFYRRSQKEVTMLSEFQCKDCSAQFVVAFSVESDRPLRRCVVCGKDNLLFLRLVDEEKIGKAQPPMIDVQRGIRYCFEVGQKVLVRVGTTWRTSTILKITVLRNGVSCPQCGGSLFGEPRFWFSGYGNWPISEVMATEDIDPSEPALRPDYPVGKASPGVGFIVTNLSAKAKGI